MTDIVCNFKYAVIVYARVAFTTFHRQKTLDPAEAGTSKGWACHGKRAINDAATAARGGASDEWTNHGQCFTGSAGEGAAESCTEKRRAQEIREKAI